MSALRIPQLNVTKTLEVLWPGRLEPPRHIKSFVFSTTRSRSALRGNSYEFNLADSVGCVDT